MKTCSVHDCEGEHHARGWCFKHYSRWYRTGRVEDTVTEGCSVCGKPAVGLLLCRYHYNRWTTYGTPDKGAATPRIVERHTFPTRPWLTPAAGGKDIVHVQSWVLLANGYRKFVAACNLRIPLMHVEVESPRPCLKCVNILRRHGLIA